MCGEQMMPLLPELDGLFGLGSTMMSSLTGLKAVISQVIENQSLMHSLRPILVCARQNSSFVLGDGALRRPGVAARRPYL